MDLNEKYFTENYAADIYTLLVLFGGAQESMRYAFIIAMMKDKTKEWRFQGHLGFGGKYRCETNTVDCYGEDETLQRLEIINDLNRRLSELYKKHYS